MQFLGDYVPPRKKGRAKQVVLMIKRKREEIPQERLIIEERVSKKSKVDIVDAFNNLNLTNQLLEPTFSNKKYFRYFGSGVSNDFDVNKNLKDAKATTLPPIYSKKQSDEKLVRTNSSCSMFSGQITKRTGTQGIDFLELEHVTSDQPMSSSIILQPEYHYYYMDEDANDLIYQNDVVIQLESFLDGLFDENEEYDDDLRYSDDEKEIDYPDTPSGGSIDSWERNSSDSGNAPGYSSNDDNYYDDY